MSHFKKSGRYNSGKISVMRPNYSAGSYRQAIGRGPEFPTPGFDDFALASETQKDTAALARENSERDAAKAALENRQIPMFQSDHDQIQP